MAKYKYKLTAQEVTELKEIAKFYVRLQCKRKNIDFETIGRIAYRAIATDIVKLYGGSYYNQIDHPGLKIITLSKVSIGHFDKFLGKVLRDPDASALDGFDEVTTLYHKLRKQLNEKLVGDKWLYKSETSKPETGSLKTKNLYERSFEHSIWYCYSRHDSDKKEKELGRIIIYFYAFDKNCSCPVSITHYLEGRGTWKGHATFNEIDKILIITAFHTETGRDYTHFLFKVDNTLRKLELCIGHVSYRNKRHANIVTKTVIIERVPNGSTVPVAQGFSFNTEILSKHILKFFSNRSLNRLSSPHSMPVYDLETLEAWLNKKEKGKNQPYLSIIGDYTVFYRRKPFSREFIEDSICLETAFNNQLSARYIHNYQTEIFRWTGVLYANFDAKALTGQLKGPQAFNGDLDSTELDNSKPIFLVINIPVREKQKIDTLTGIIVSTRDGDKGSVGRLFVMVKLVNGTYPDRFDLDALNIFFDFYSDRSWIRPPAIAGSPSISEFDDLAKAIKNSIKLNNENSVNL